MSKYLVYYKDSDKYRYYDGKEFKSANTIFNLKINFFEMHHSYENSDEGLKLYYDNMKIWSEQIKSKFTVSKNPFDYLNRFSDTKSIEGFCTIFCANKIKTHDSITFTEQKWIEKTNNAGLMTCKPTEQAKKIYSYDGKGFYQHILSSNEFMIPDKEGYETILSELPKRNNLKHGFYRVKISSSNPHAKLVFAFNSDNIYYYYDLNFALSHRKTLNFEFELIQDGDPNAYIYDSIIESSSVFGRWNKMINELKKECPENKLLKNLGSKCWGVMSKRCQIQIDDKELDDNFEKYKNCDIIRTKKFGEYGCPDFREIHYLQDETQPYKHNIRLKTQITSFARAYIATFAMADLDNLVRIHTDCVAFTKPQKIDKKLFKREEKSSGLIQFYSCNKYKHECWRCHSQFKYEDYLKHKCN